MPAYSQTPGELGIACVRGDEVNFSIQFADIDLTGYTLTAAVYTGAGNTMTVVTTPVVAVTSDGTDSTVAVSLTETMTMAISPITATRWYLRWVSPGGVTRTILSGVVSAKNP
jgi:hypothetical protein